MKNYFMPPVLLIKVSYKIFCLTAIAVEIERREVLPHRGNGSNTSAVVVMLDCPFHRQRNLSDNLVFISFK